jgi:ferredoxin-NADP reductase
MAEYQMTLTNRQSIARDTMAFWFDANGARYEFRAGQHADFVFGRITRPAVFLAGGIGITPIRSILRSAIQEHLGHKLYLFYSNREADDAAFIEELQGMTAENPNFTFVPSLSRFLTVVVLIDKSTIKKLAVREIVESKSPLGLLSRPSCLDCSAKRWTS